MARGVPASARSSTLVGGGFSISPKTFDEMWEAAQDAKSSAERAHQAVDAIIMYMAYFTRSEAMKMSLGPVASRQRSNPAFANRIPVQRITGAYYAGWYVKRLGQGIWAVGNKSKEGYLIEVGMYQRNRRPVLKMSVINMLRFLQTTHLAESFGDSLIAPRRNAKGRFQSFNTRIGSFKMSNPPLDMPNRGAKNPHISGPTGVLS